MGFSLKVEFSGDVHVHLHGSHHDEGRESLRHLKHVICQSLSKVDIIMTPEQQAAFDAMGAAVQQATTVGDAVEALVDGMAQQIKDLAAQVNDPAVAAKLNELAGTLTTNNAELQAKVTENTPAAPAPSMRGRP